MNFFDLHPVAAVEAATPALAGAPAAAVSPFDPDDDDFRRPMTRTPVPQSNPEPTMACSPWSTSSG